MARGKRYQPEQVVSHACEHGVSERHACLLLGQPRGTQRYRPTQREDEDRLTQAIVALASQYGRYVWSIRPRSRFPFVATTIL